MTTYCTAPSSGVPDLLRRFTRTPLSFRFAIGATQILLQTNDSHVLGVAALFQASATLRCSTGPIDGDTAFLWRIIREKVVSHHTALSIVITDSLSILLRGDTTAISVDRKAREVLGFIAADVTDEELRAQMFPLLAKWCESTPPHIASEPQLGV